MRGKFFILLFLILAGTSAKAFCFSQGCIEVDLNNNKVKAVDFSLGDYKVKGDFSFALDREEGSLAFDLTGKDIGFEDKNFPWLNMKLVKSGDIIFINSLAMEGLNAKGEVDLKENRLSLNIDSKWEEKSEFLKGLVSLKLKVWGDLNCFTAAGSLVIANGTYKGKEFLKLSIDFLGRPPLLNITDSQITLKNGNVLEMEGVLDLRNSGELIPNAEFIVQKIFIDDWQLFSEGGKNIGLKKNINKNLNVCLNTPAQEGQEAKNTETELTYSLQKDQFLKLKREDGKTILGFERRRSF